MNKDKREDDYIIVAKFAVTLEQAGTYQTASRLWTEAALLSINPINKQWANSRGSFCERQFNKMNNTPRK
ncbi:ANR family transcriptional regulator [Enterobacter asburiae]|uniref:ANR family transcriptional regulator n=1 Tax=Enterobacter asburiae TaxID=61645 RepID=UPI00192B4B2C|nr:ANR family transcriptional regulator [Enterobacter asburiae]MBL5950343.1 ANR family transcriptional regulator [Enterobacter asburiae]